MSKGKRSRWRWRLAGLVLLVLAGVWVWWQVQLRNPHSVPHFVAYVVWPWAKWPALAGLLVLGY